MASSMSSREILPISTRCATTGRALPPFSSLLGRTGEPRDLVNIALTSVLMVLTLLALQETLGMVFDPRYRDFAFAPLSAAVIPFLVLTFSSPRRAGRRAMAETVAAAVLAACALYIMPNETFANWQAIWFCAAILGIAFILVRVRDAPDSI